MSAALKSGGLSSLRRARLGQDLQKNADGSKLGRKATARAVALRCYVRYRSTVQETGQRQACSGPGPWLLTIQRHQVQVACLETSGRSHLTCCCRRRRLALDATREAWVKYPWPIIFMSTSLA
jgi:hypothetical protein